MTELLHTGGQKICSQLSTASRYYVVFFGLTRAVDSGNKEVQIVRRRKYHWRSEARKRGWALKNVGN